MRYHATQRTRRALLAFCGQLVVLGLVLGLVVRPLLRTPVQLAQATASGSVDVSAMTGTNVTYSGGALRLAQGSATNEVQTVTATNVASGVNGTITVPATGLGSGGSVTVSPTESAAALQSALEAKASIGSGNVSVSGSTTIPASTITVGNGPQQSVVLPDGSKTYVTNITDGTVSVINNATKTVSKTITVGTGPAWIATNPTGTKVYVSNTEATTVSIISTSTDTVIASPTVNGNPEQIVAAPDGTKMYVAATLGSVQAISTTTNAVVSSVSVANPFYIAISPDGSRLYANSGGSLGVAVINTSSNTVVTTVSTGNRPGQPVVSADGSKVYVPLYNVLTGVDVISASSNTITKTISMPWGATTDYLSPDGSRLVVVSATTNQVSIVNTATDTALATVTVGTTPKMAAFDSASSKAYIATYGSNAVYVVNLSTNAVKTSLATGSGTDWVSISPDGLTGYALNSGTTTVTAFSTASDSLTSSGTYTATFQGALAGTNISQMTVSGSGWSAGTTTNGAPAPYLTPGVATGSITPAVGTYNHWQSVSATTSTPANTSLTLTYSPDNLTYVSSLAQVAPSQTLYVRATLVTTNTAVTPTLSALSVSYTPIGLSWQSPNGGESFLIGAGTGAVSTIPLSWNVPDTTGADHIHLRYSADSGSSWTDIAASLSPSSTSYSWTPPSGLTTTTARAQAILETSSGSALATGGSAADFTVISNQAPTAALQTPSDGASFSNGTSVSLTALVSDADANTTDTVDIQLATDSGFSSIVASVSGQQVAMSSGSGTASLTKVLSPSSATAYYWRARATDKYGAQSDWTGVRSFRVAAPVVITRATPTPTPVTTAAPTSPADGSSPTPTSASGGTTPTATASAPGGSTGGGSAVAITLTVTALATPQPSVQPASAGASPTPPPPPPFLLTWRTDAPAQGYKIYRATDPNVPIDSSHLLAVIPDATTTTYVDTTVNSATPKVYYQVVTIPPTDANPVGSNIVQVNISYTLPLFHPDQPETFANPPALIAHDARTGAGAGAGISLVGILTGVLTAALGAALLDSSSPRGVLQYLFLFMPGRRRKRPWGHVYSRQTKLPVTGAQVGLVPAKLQEKIYQAVADLSGGFSFLLRQPGRFRLAVSAPGFASYTSQEEEFGTEPPKKDRIVYLPQIPGRYKVPYMRQARLMIALSRAAVDITWVIFSLGFLLALYNVLLFHDLTAWSVLAFYVAMLLIQLRSLFKVRVSGYVGTAQGRPVAQAAVRAYAVRGQEKVFVASTLTAADGTYRLSLPAGTYVLGFSHETYEPFVSDQVTLKHGSDETLNANLASSGFTPDA